MFLAGFVLSLVTILKGLKHIGLSVSFEQGLLYSVFIAVLVALSGKFFISRLEFDETACKTTHYANNEKDSLETEASKLILLYRIEKPLLPHVSQMISPSFFLYQQEAR